MTSSTRERARPRARGLIAGIAALVALYVAVIALYAWSGRVQPTAESSGGEGQELILELTPVEINGAGDRMSLRIDPIQLGAYSTDGFSMDEKIEVLVTGTDGSRTIVYGADEVAGAQTVTLILDGYIEQWPFDRYTAETLILPTRADASGESVPIPYELTAQGRVPGWAVDAEGVSLYPVVTSDGEIEMVGVQFTITRAASTIAFGIVLLSLMVIAPVLVLTAAITVYRGRRKIEVTMLGWLGAMLFATIPLRNFLPGSPPIGSWVDYLIVLWVIAGLIAGMVVFVLAWLRDGAPGVRPAEPAAVAAGSQGAEEPSDGADGDSGPA